MRRLAWLGLGILSCQAKPTASTPAPAPVTSTQAPALSSSTQAPALSSAPAASSAPPIPARPVRELGATGDAPRGVRADSRGRVYWMGAHHQKDGSLVRRLAPGSTRWEDWADVEGATSRLVLSGDDVAWFSSTDGVMGWSSQGRSPHHEKVARPRVLADVVLRDGHLWYVTSEVQYSQGVPTGHLVKVELATGKRTTLATSLLGATCLGVDDTSVYWWSSEERRLHAIPHAGARAASIVWEENPGQMRPKTPPRLGAPREEASSRPSDRGQPWRFLSIDATSMFFSDRLGNTFEWKRAEKTRVDVFGRGVQVAVDARYLVYTQGLSIWRRPRQGGPAEMIAQTPPAPGSSTGPLDTITDLALSGTNLYWVAETVDHRSSFYTTEVP